MRTFLLALRTTKALFPLTQQRLMLFAHSGPWPAVSPLCARNGRLHNLNKLKLFKNEFQFSGKVKNIIFCALMIVGYSH